MHLPISVVFLFKKVYDSHRDLSTSVFTVNIQTHYLIRYLDRIGYRIVQKEQLSQNILSLLLLLLLLYLLLLLLLLLLWIRTKENVSMSYAHRVGTGNREHDLVMVRFCKYFSITSYKSISGESKTLIRLSAL